MSWLSKLLPPKVQSDTEKGNVPEGLWQKCDGCNEILYYTDLEHNLKVCPKCSYHHQLTAKERLNLFFDDCSKCSKIQTTNQDATNQDATNQDATEQDDTEQDDTEQNAVGFIGEEVKPIDILNFVDSKPYKDRLLAMQQATDEDDALVVMLGKVGGMEVVIASFEFRFIGGSMGSVVGERFVRGVQKALDRHCPFICVCASGGARMQEGVNSLMQMAKTCAILTTLSDKGLPFISILTNPTMGGVSASFAFLGDVVIAEPGALIGFAGPRVIEQTVRQKLPDGFQRAEFLINKGAIDMIVSRHQLKATVIQLINLLLNK